MDPREEETEPCKKGVRGQGGGERERERNREGRVVQKQKQRWVGYCRGGCCQPGPVPGAPLQPPSGGLATRWGRKGVAGKSGLVGVGLLLQ